MLYPGHSARSRSVLAVREASDGGLWAGTESGLYRMTKGSKNLTRFDTGPLPKSWSEPAVTVLEEDRVGNLWFGGYAGIGRIRKDGSVDRWTPRQGFASTSSWRFTGTSMARSGSERKRASATCGATHSQASHLPSDATGAPKACRVLIFKPLSVPRVENSG